jgi:heme-degrading monooxygenase HmoA
MYKRYYKLTCLDEPKMKRFRIVTTQGLPFEQLMKNYSVRMPGFISATDTHFDDERWEIETIWESKKHFDDAQKHPMRKMFWTRFEVEVLRHDIQFIIIDGDTGESFEPLSLD